MITRRRNHELASDAVLTQLAVASILSEQAGKDFRKLIVDMGEE